MNASHCATHKLMGFMETFEGTQPFPIALTCPEAQGVAERQ